MDEWPTIEKETHRGCIVRIVADDDTEHMDPRQDDNLGKMLCAHPDYILGDTVPGPAREYTPKGSDGKFLKNEDGSFLKRYRHDLANALDPGELEKIGPPTCASCDEPIRRWGSGWRHAATRKLRCDDFYTDEAEPRGDQWPTLEAYLIAEHDMAPGSPVLSLYLLDHSGLSMTCSPSPFDPSDWDTSMVGFAFVTNKGVADCGTPPELWEEVLTSEISTYSSWLEGDVAGWVAESPDGEVIESCWGYIGYEEHDYMMSEARSAADTWVDAHEARVDAALATDGLWLVTA